AGMVVSALIFLPVGLADLNLPGYANLDVRLSVPAEFGEPRLLPATPPAEDAEPGELGEGPPVPAWRDARQKSLLPLDLDRDRDGRPDLLLTKDKLDVGRVFDLPPEMQLIFAV